MISDIFPIEKFMGKIYICPICDFPAKKVFIKQGRPAPAIE